MKDTHITIIWGIATITFSIWLTSVIGEGEDYIECLAISALFFQLLFGAYCVLSLIINGALREYAIYRYKLPIKNKFKDKKSPIYELQYSYLNGTYGISKWELKWCDSDDWFIPFSALFQTYKYVEVGNYGRFLKEDLDNLKSLRFEYRTLANLNTRENNIEISAKDKLKQKIEKLNTEFTNNYIE